MIEQTRFVERIQFFEGQRLFAEDLQAIEAFNREMRWLHNRSLHQPGIGSGLAVTGQKGDRQVTVNPGYAIDKDGREIVLTQPQVLQVPPVGGGADGRPAVFDLTIAYPEDSALEEAETRQGVCGTAGVVRLREAPVFCWVELKSDDPKALYVETRFQQEILEAKKIIVGRVAVRNCRLDHFIDIRVRRDARPNCLPYVACGIQTPTQWVPMHSGDWPMSGYWIPRLVFSGAADTSTANFQTVPRYQAQVVGSIEMTITLEHKPPDVPIGTGDPEVGIVEGGGTIEETATQTVDIDIVLAYDLFLRRQDVRDLEAVVVVKPVILQQELPDWVSSLKDPLEKILAEIESHIKAHWNIQWMGVEG